MSDTNVLLDSWVKWLQDESGQTKTSTWLVVGGVHLQGVCHVPQFTLHIRNQAMTSEAEDLRLGPRGSPLSPTPSASLWLFLSSSAKERLKHDRTSVEKIMMATLSNRTKLEKEEFDKLPRLTLDFRLKISFSLKNKDIYEWPQTFEKCFFFHFVIELLSVD